MSNPVKNKPYVVALTGGIASGKTAVSDCFSKLGVPVIDTDVISHQLVKPGQPLLNAIKDEFGPEMLDESGHLRRKHLRAHIFSNAEERFKLEAILHPAIFVETTKRISEVMHPYCLVVIPLLAEVGVPEYVDRVLVVDVDQETQLARLVIRDAINYEQAGYILSAQASREDRLALADDVLSNQGSLSTLTEKVAQLNNKYLELAIHSSHATQQ